MNDNLNDKKRKKDHRMIKSNSYKNTRKKKKVMHDNFDYEKSILQKRKTKGTKTESVITSMIMKKSS